jgi:hypothetical protein
MLDIQNAIKEGAQNLAQHADSCVFNVLVAATEMKQIQNALREQLVREQDGAQGRIEAIRKRIQRCMYMHSSSARSLIFAQSPTQLPFPNWRTNLQPSRCVRQLSLKLRPNPETSDGDPEENAGGAKSHRGRRSESAGYARPTSVFVLILFGGGS